MKKTAAALALLLALSLSACQDIPKKGANLTDDPSITPTPDPAASITALADIAELTSADLATGLGAGAAAQLKTAKLAGTSFEINSNMLLAGNYLYYIDGNDDRKLKRIPANADEKTNPEIVIGGSTSQFFVSGGMLYASASSGGKDLLIKVDLSDGAKLARVEFKEEGMPASPMNLKLQGDRIWFSFTDKDAESGDDVVGIGSCGLDGKDVRILDSARIDSESAEYVFETFEIDHANGDVYYQKAAKLMKWSAATDEKTVFAELSVLYKSGFNAYSSLGAVLEVTADSVVYLDNQSSETEFGAVRIPKSGGSQTVTPVKRADYRTFWTVSGDYLFAVNDYAVTRYKLGTAESTVILKGRVTKIYVFAPGILFYTTTPGLAFYAADLAGEKATQIPAELFYQRMGSLNVYGD